jgi:hypothetical protein
VVRGIVVRRWVWKKELTFKTSILY